MIKSFQALSRYRHFTGSVVGTTLQIDVSGSALCTRAKVAACGRNPGCSRAHNLGTPTQCLTAQHHITAQHQIVAQHHIVAEDSPVV